MLYRKVFGTHRVTNTLFILSAQSPSEDNAQRGGLAKKIKKPSIVKKQLLLLQHEVYACKEKAKTVGIILPDGVVYKYKGEKETNNETTLKQILEERKENKRKEQEYILANSGKFIPMTYIASETEEDPLHRK